MENDNEGLRALKISEVLKSTCGSKSYNMKLLIDLKDKINLYQTPTSMCIPYQVYIYFEKYLSNNNIIKLDNCSLKEVENLAENVRNDYILSILKSNDDHLEKICNDFQSNFNNNCLLAIRSSSNLEDLKKSAGAGLFDSKVGIEINNKQSIKQAIVEVWSSIFTSRGVISRKKAKISNFKGKMAILVQEMMNPELSFVIHTINPITLNKNEVYIELAYGLGETLASSNQKGSPFRITYNKLHQKAEIYNYSSYPLSLERDNSNSVSYRRINYCEEKLFNHDDLLISIALKLGKIGQFLENELGDPQDIEGGITSENEIYLVQTRPQMI